MALYGVRLVINLFDLCIYRRYLEEFIGNRKTSMEFSVLLLIVCELIGSAEPDGDKLAEFCDDGCNSLYCKYAERVDIEGFKELYRTTYIKG